MSERSDKELASIVTRGIQEASRKNPSLSFHEGTEIGRRALYEAGWNARNDEVDRLRAALVLAEDCLAFKDPEREHPLVETALAAVRAALGVTPKGGLSPSSTKEGR